MLFNLPLFLILKSISIYKSIFKLALANRFLAKTLLKMGKDVISVDKKCHNSFILLLLFCHVSGKVLPQNRFVFCKTI